MYYDKYLKKDNDGICLNCGRPTLFKNLVRVIRNLAAKNVKENVLKLQTKKDMVMNVIIKQYIQESKKRFYDKTFWCRTHFTS